MRIVNPKRFAISMVVIIAIVGIAVFAVLSSQEKVIAGEEYIISQGESLWEIAASKYPTKDTREVVEDICSLSDCTALVHPGDCIILPEYRK